MLNKIIFTRVLFLKLIFALLLVSNIINGQTVVDSTNKAPKTIKLSEVSIKSGEIWTESKRLFETLISDTEIQSLKDRNDSIIDKVDNFLEHEVTINLHTKNIRYLNNKKTQLSNFSSKIDIEKEALLSKIKVLTGYKKTFEEKIKLWEDTKLILKNENADPTIIKRIDELLSNLNNLSNQIKNKNEKLLLLLDNISVTDIKLINQNDIIVNTISDKEKEIFVKDQPTVFTIDYFAPERWGISDPLHIFYQTEVVGLLKYYHENVQYFLLQLFVLIILILLFTYVKRNLLNADIEQDTIYTRYLVRLFSRNISAALLIGLFFSVIIFPNRPELLKDIVSLIAIIPLTLMVSTIVNKQFIKYLILFVIIFYLRMIDTIFPPDNLFSTFSMIILGVIEVYALWQIVRALYRKKQLKSFVNTLFVLLILLNIGFAVVGLGAVLYGSTLLAEVAFGVPIENVYIGILFFIILIIVNGFVVLAIKTKELRELNVIKIYGYEIRTRVIKFNNILAVLFWLNAILHIINIRDVVVGSIVSFFTDEIHIGSTSFSIWGVIVFFIVIWISITLARIIKVLLEQDVLNKLQLGKGVSHTIAMMARYSIITLGVLLAISAADIPIDNLTVLFGAFGVGIGFGLQNIFNNIVSGFILLFERPIQIGDTIELSQLNLLGIVNTIGVRSSNVRTFDGAEVIVPNGQLISNEVINWTLSDKRRRIEIIAGVAYGSNPHQVKELLIKILEAHPDIIKTPTPVVLFNNLGDSSLDFRMLFWTANSSEWIRIRSEVMFEIHDVFQKEGITIPFPQMDIHMAAGADEKS